MCQENEVLNTSVGALKHKSALLPSLITQASAVSLLSCQALQSPVSDDDDLEHLSLLVQAVPRYIGENHTIADNDQWIPLVRDYEDLDIYKSLANVHPVILADVATPGLDPYPVRPPDQVIILLKQMLLL